MKGGRYQSMVPTDGLKQLNTTVDKRQVSRKIIFRSSTEKEKLSPMISGKPKEIMGMGMRAFWR